MDGERCVDQPVIYFTRNKLSAGKYLLFYRAAFRNQPYGGSGIGGTGDYHEADTKKADPRAARMDDGQRESKKSKKQKRGQA